MIYPDEKEPNTGHKKTTNTPLVSIVMGTYNGEKYLREQLESIYGQTYQNIEVIICDDSSTDGTVKILSEFSREFGLTYYVNKANLGLVRNYEKALSLAKGDYLALADQDDIWYPGKIELLLDNIGTYSLIHSSVHVIDGNGNPNGDEFVVSEYSRDHTNKTNFSDFLETAWVLGCTSLIEKSLLEKSQPFPEGVMFHDWWLTMAAIKLGRGIKYIHKPTIKYRQYGGNTAFKFYMDLSWHKKRFEFYKVLALRFNDNLSLEERAKLSAVSNQNAAQFILMGLQRNEDGPVKQFLQENSDLLTVPFIREIISSHRANIRREFGGIEGQTTRIDNTARDPTYQFILSLRSKLYSPISTWDRIISIFHRRVFRPLIYIPIKRIYHAIRSHAGH